MNERIQELFKQAYGYFPSPIGEPETEKFAELIVQECASICYKSLLLDADAHAQNLLYEFNIDNCRGQK